MKIPTRLWTVPLDPERLTGDDNARTTPVTDHWGWGRVVPEGHACWFAIVEGDTDDGIVRLGNVQILRRWTASVDHPDELPFVAEVEITDDAILTIVSEKFEDRDGGHVSRAKRRDTPVLRFASQLWWLAELQPGDLEDHGGPSVKLWEPALTTISSSRGTLLGQRWNPNLPHLLPSPLRPPGRGRQLTDEFLTEVAEAYRKAVAGRQRPVKAICEQWGPIHRSTASMWVRRARERGLLAPARERHTGEFPEGDET